MSLALGITPAVVAALRQVITDVDAGNTAAAEIVGKVDAIVAKVEALLAEQTASARRSTNLLEELQGLGRHAHKLSNRFVALHEQTMQIIDDATGVTDAS